MDLQQSKLCDLLYLIMRKNTGCRGALLCFAFCALSVPSPDEVCRRRLIGERGSGESGHKRREPVVKMVSSTWSPRIPQMQRSRKEETRTANGEQRRIKKMDGGER